MFFPWCCGTGKEGLFRWRRAPERRPELCLADCLEQLSTLLALPQMPSDDGPQGFHVLEDLHRLLHDVTIQVEKALSQRSAEAGNGGASVGSRCHGVSCKSGIGDVAALRDGAIRCYNKMETLCIRCAQVPASLCLSCSRDSSSVPGDVSASRCRGSLQQQGLRNPCRLRPQRPRLRPPAQNDQAPLKAAEVHTANSSATKESMPQQFYIGDDEAWRCDDPADNVPPVAGGAWRSELGLPKQQQQQLQPMHDNAGVAKHSFAAWEKQARLRACDSEGWEEQTPRERANTISLMRRQLNGLSEHSRHLLTVPVSVQGSDRASSSTGGTFREFFARCSSEDMVLIPPSCLEARRQQAEESGNQARGAPAPTFAGAINGVDCQTKENDISDVAVVLRNLPPPAQFFDDEEDCDCERYAVSRQKDGRLTWAPEPLRAG